MNNVRPPSDIIAATESHVRAACEGEASGHDWWHVWRVVKNAERIARKEKGVDRAVVRLAALLHDIADHKFHGGDHDIGPATARAWLDCQGLDEERIAHVVQIVRDVSFSASQGRPNMPTLEGRVVQDADRLDAMGAIGIARTFATNARLGRAMHDPEHPDVPTAIAHFHEKLLRLKDLMNTDEGKRLAEKRHAFMQAYLDAFHEEWGEP